MSEENKKIKEKLMLTFLVLAVFVLIAVNFSLYLKMDHEPVKFKSDLQLKLTGFALSSIEKGNSGQNSSKIQVSELNLEKESKNKANRNKNETLDQKEGGLGIGKLRIFNSKTNNKNVNLSANPTNETEVNLNIENKNEKQEVSIEKSSTPSTPSSSSKSSSSSPSSPSSPLSPFADEEKLITQKDISDFVGETYSSVPAEAISIKENPIRILPYIIVLGIIIMLIFIFRILRKAMKENKQMEIKLRDWINQARLVGYSPDRIQEILENSEWDKDLVKKVLAKQG